MPFGSTDETLVLANLIFEWNRIKARTNEKTHGLTFAEAASVFFDPNALLIEDPDHSEAEQRFVLLGYSVQERMLVVVHVHRGQRLRLISARRATARERMDYES